MEAQTITTATSQLDRTTAKSASPYHYRHERTKHHNVHHHHETDKLTLSTSRVFPTARSSSITLRPATASERLEHSYISAPSWKGPLPTAEAFVRREDLLHNTTICRHGGITGWILADKEGRMLMGGESIRKRGLLCRAGQDEVEDVVVHSVGAVFCPEEHRGRGYARRFMDELARRLGNWQRTEGQKVLSVLYSEIGRDFYARHGWHAHSSKHIRLPVEGSDANQILRLDKSIEWPENTHPVYAKDIATLATRDEVLLRQQLRRRATDSGQAFALVPDVETFDWFRAREGFVCNELYGNKTAPSVHGAVVRDAHSGNPLAWCLWTCMWFEADDVNVRGRNTLYILRLVVDEEECGKSDRSDHVRESAIAALFEAGKEYATRWGMGGVEAWNPDEMTLRAAERAGGGAEVKVVDRTMESIACLKMYGGGGGDGDGEVEWIANEKFGWC